MVGAIPAYDLHRQLQKSITLAQRVVASSLESSTEWGLNHVAFIAEVNLADVDATDLENLIAEGHLVDVQTKPGPWGLHLRRGGVGGEVTETSGQQSAAVAQHRLDDLQSALDAEDFAGLLHLSGTYRADLTIRVINRPEVSGFHWLGASAALTQIIDSALWMPLANRMAQDSNRVLVADLDTEVLQCEGLTFLGPRAVEPSGPGAPLRDLLDSSFRAGRATTGESSCSPLALTPVHRWGEISSPALYSILREIRRLRALLIWTLIANASEPMPGAVRVQIDGARQVRVDVHPSGDDEHDHLLEIYKWVGTSSEIDRLYFIQQALSLAIVTSDDLGTAPEHALRTARSLYDLSRSNAVSEIMAARRSAREIALGAGRAAAAQAREAASKATERVMLQIAAAGAIIVAQVQNALSLHQSAFLLLLLAVLCVASAFTMDVVVLRSARDGLQNEMRDLERYRDTLSKDDIGSVQSVGVVVAAREDLRRARVTTWLAYGLATIVMLAAALVALDLGKSDSPNPDPSPTRSFGTSSPAV